MQRMWCETYHDNVAIEILTDIDIALHDGVESGDMDTTAFKTQERLAGREPQEHGNARCQW